MASSTKHAYANGVDWKRICIDMNGIDVFAKHAPQATKDIAASYGCWMYLVEMPGLCNAQVAEPINALLSLAPKRRTKGR
ncbi:MAG: hypothetical protein AAGJ35_12065, partial [Myxococcota bacterium]